jgi:PAS domain S-box-containing protein
VPLFGMLRRGGVAGMTARFGSSQVDLDRPGGNGTFHEPGAKGTSSADATAGGLAELLDHAPVLVLTTDADLRYTWAAGSVPGWPDAGRTAVGRTAWEVIGTRDATHPWIASLRQALRGEQAHARIERDGVHLDYWVGPYRDPDRRPVGTVAVVLDTTDAEQAGRRQRAAEERFRQLAEHSPAIIDVRDGEDRIVHANRAFLHTFGVGLTDVIGWRPSERADLGRVEGSDFADLVETGHQVRRSGTARVWQGRIPHPDGYLVELLGHVFPLPTEDGTARIGEVFLDVTAHERARRELADTEQRFRAFFNAAEIGVLVLDLAATVLDANPTALRLTGRSLHEVRGCGLDVALSAADLERHRPLWNELVAGRRGRYDLTVTLRSSDARQRPARLTVTLVRNRDGAPSTVLCLAVPMAPETDTAALPTRSLPSAGEAAVLERLAAGASLQQIATDLGMSRRGVDYRITRLRHKLRADGPGGAPATSAALIARAYTLGILHPAVWPPRVVDLPQIDDRAE